MLIGGVLLLLAGPLPLIGLVWLGSFVAANLFGLALWRRRGWLRLYPTLQLFIFTLAVLSLGNILVADWSGSLATLGNGSPFSRRTAYGVLLIFPAIMLLFYFQERFGRRRQSASCSSAPSTSSPSSDSLPGSSTSR